MFHTYYVTTAERTTGRRHNYRQPLTEALPDGHEFVNGTPAGTFPIVDMVDDNTRVAMAKLGTAVLVRGKRGR